MTALGSYLLLATLAVQSPEADSLRALARRLPESALVVEVRTHPLAVSEALTEAFARAVRAPAMEREEELETASRLAAAYAVVWRDSFYSREVARFVSWSQARRAAKVWADSTRRAGVIAFGRDGPRAAITVWRRALSRARGIRDTAGVAAVLGNIGAAFLEEGSLDSAEAYLDQARSLAAAIGSARVEANAVGMLAGVSEERGDLARARDLYARSLELRERIGDTRGEAADRNNLGLLSQSTGGLDEARRHFEAALALNRRDGREEAAATNLVNLAGVAALVGEYARAQKLYRDALAIWRVREQWADAADALHGLGQLELRRGDYPSAAAVLREAIAIRDRTGPITDAVIVRQELANALASAGMLQDGIDELRRAGHIADSAQAPAGIRAGLALARADLAVQLNRFAEAERLYGTAQRLYEEAGDLAGRAAAQHGLGALLLEREEYGRALALLAAALRAQEAAGDRRAAAVTRLSMGHSSWLRRDTLAARRQLARAAADLDRIGDPVASAAALGERAALEAESGNPAAAESLYRAALHRLDDRLAPEVAWRLRAGLGGVRRMQGDVDDAARHLRAGLAEIERPSRSLRLPERRSAFLADKWEVYARLALTEHERGRPVAAFEVSERLRARKMLELLEHGRVAPPRDASEELVAREQDLRRRIAELAQEVEGVAPAPEARRGPDMSRTEDAPREALLRAQTAYAELLLEMRERAPRHVALVSRETATWRAVSRRLDANEALVEYLVGDSGVLVFFADRDTIAVIELGIGRREVARLVEFARGTLEPRGSPRLDSLWRAPLRRLHRYLVAPLEEAGLLDGKTRLVLVPHAELHYLPFAALLDEHGDGRYLAERYEIGFAPSASVWLALGDRRSARATAGVLAMAPKTAQLPASHREVAAIARLADGDARVLTGAAATEEAFRREAPGRRVLHVATYGVLNKHNPLFSFVELAPGGPHDGRLEVHEVFGLGLGADLVVLSACQTGLASGRIADVPAGDDWVGLTHAFLHAGAKRVAATLWPVDDWATAALMERFYERMAAGAEPMQALAEAQRAMRQAPTTAHPFYWAGFVLVGGSDERW